MIEKRDIWFIIGTILILLGLIMSWQVAHAITYSNVGQNLTYVGMGDYIELRAKWTPGGNAYDISEGVYVDSLDLSSQDSDPTGIAFNNDGTKLYITGNGGDKIYEYNLSTPYDISTGVYNDCLGVGGQTYNPTDLAFNNDGSKLYVTDLLDNKVLEYNLSSPYDISTGVYNDYLDVSSQDSEPQGIAFNNDGTKLYVTGSSNNKAYEYNLVSSLDTATLYINITGSYQAVDTIDLGDSQTATWSNFSYSNSTTCNKAVKWKITANDSSGTSNTTTIGTFYIMPYIYSGTGLDITTCTSKHNATITPTSTGDINATFLTPYFVRNATFKECNYKITEGADRIKITNASEYCNITVINLDAESGTSFYLEEDTGTSGYPPSNLPSAIAAAGLVIIVIYTITTRKRS